MKLDYTPHFKRSYHKAPPRIQRAFDKQSALLLQELRHPSLHAKKYDEGQDLWQARVTLRCTRRNTTRAKTSGKPASPATGAFTSRSWATPTVWRELERTPNSTYGLRSNRFLSAFPPSFTGTDSRGSLQLRLLVFRQGLVRWSALLCADFLAKVLLSGFGMILLIAAALRLLAGQPILSERGDTSEWHFHLLTFLEILCQH